MCVFACVLNAGIYTCCGKHMQTISLVKISSLGHLSASDIAGNSKDGGNRKEGEGRGRRGVARKGRGKALITLLV